MSGAGRCLVSYAIAVVLATPTLAQEQPQARPVDPAKELARINATLERIADALTQQTKLDILARRIQLASTRLGDGEKRLAAVNDERSALEGEKRQLETIRESMRADSGERLDMAPREREAQLIHLESELERIDSRLQDLSRRAVDLENRLARERADLDDWQAYLDRLISSL